MGATIMAKEPKKQEPTGKPMVLGVRGSDEWKTWLRELAEHSRLNQVDVVDLALADYAKKVKFRRPPKR